VKVTDFSYSYYITDKGIRCAGGSLTSEYEVIQTNVKMPIWSRLSGDAGPMYKKVPDNDTLIKEISTGKIVSIQERFLRKIEGAKPAPKFKTGDKVVPVKKSVCGPLDSSNKWREAQEIKQPFIYVINPSFYDEYAEKTVVICHGNKNANSGDYFLESDLVPYVEPVPEVKPEPKFKVGDKVKGNRHSLHEGITGEVIGLKGNHSVAVLYPVKLSCNSTGFDYDFPDKAGYGWYEPIGWIDLLPKDPEPTFNNRTESITLNMYPLDEVMTVKTIFNDRATICILGYDGKRFKGVAKCNPDDTYHEKVGRGMSYDRARIELAKYRIDKSSHGTLSF